MPDNDPRLLMTHLQTAVSMTNFLTRAHEQQPNVNFFSHSEEQHDEQQAFDGVGVSANTVVIDVDVDEEANRANQTTNDGASPERAQVIEAQQILQTLLKYVPFVLILAAKAVYDHHDSIFVMAVLLATFGHCNSVVKRQAARRHRRSLTTLAAQLLYVLACGLFMHYFFDERLGGFNLLHQLMLFKTLKESLTVGKLLWIVLVTDLALKLVTVAVKVMFAMLPGCVVSFQRRGKVYCFVEAASQMYRSIATIQPWLHYLLESYEGSDKIVAVFLSAFYMISKGSDLMSRLKVLRAAFFKLLQNVAVGSPPSKEQIQTAGQQCPICHDEFDSPVLLQCRHIFCENCVTTWFDREQTCPLCRAKIVDDPVWRDGATTYFLQLY